MLLVLCFQNTFSWIISCFQNTSSQHTLKNNLFVDHFEAVIPKASKAMGDDSDSDEEEIAAW